MKHHMNILECNSILTPVVDQPLTSVSSVHIYIEPIILCNITSCQGCLKALSTWGKGEGLKGILCGVMKLKKPKAGSIKTCSPRKIGKF